MTKKEIELKQRTKLLEESLRELKGRMREQEEKLKEQEQRLKALEECEGNTPSNFSPKIYEKSLRRSVRGSGTTSAQDSAF